MQQPINAPLWFAARASAFAALCAFGMQPLVANAQIVVDPSAASRATLGTSGNGTSVVNIVAPNAAGVSNNRFTQYNVGTGGVVLNNSTTATQTRIGGTVQGNAALGQNANLILMQVTGGSASQLLGTTEVAGRGANVVVANPAGITCSGCGFLNAPRVTLATGTPTLASNGALQSIDVKSGTITVQGNGLNASSSAVDLISRAMTINGRVQGQTIDAIAGANRVDYASKNAVAQAGTGAKPQVAIDVQSLGSMYGDGAVRLIGTEAGVGVRNNGTISSLNNEISVTSNGDLTVGSTGAIKAVNGGVNALVEANVSNAGTISGIGVNVVGQQSLTSSGTIDGGRETNLYGDRLTLAGGSVKGGVVTLSGRTIANQGATVTADQQLTFNSSRFDNAGTLVSGGDTRINAQDTFANANGSVKAQGNVQFDGATLDNSKGKLTAVNGDVFSQGARVINTNGIMNAGSTLSLDAQGIDNSQGTMSASLARINVNGDLNNVGGTIATVNRADVNVQGKVSNAKGSVKAGDALTLETGEIDNRNGAISTDRGALRLSGMTVMNGNGRIASGDSFDVRGGALDNTAGTIVASRDVNLSMYGKLVNDNGSITSKTIIGGNAGSLSNDKGTLSAPIANLRTGDGMSSIPSGNGGSVPQPQPQPTPALAPAPDQNPNPNAFDPGPGYVKVSAAQYDPNQFRSGFWAPDGYFYGYVGVNSSPVTVMSSMR